MTDDDHTTLVGDDGEKPSCRRHDTFHARCDYCLRELNQQRTCDNDGCEAHTKAHVGTSDGTRHLCGDCFRDEYTYTQRP